jgi:ankyrin repeat protein
VSHESPLAYWDVWPGLSAPHPAAFAAACSGDTTSLAQSLAGHTAEKLAELDSYDNTLLHYAVCSGSVASVTTLLAAGPAVDMTNRDRWHSPLHFAGKQPTGSGLLRPLLDHAKELAPAAISAQDRDGNTPLHYAVSRACLCGSAINVVMLLAAGEASWFGCCLCCHSTYQVSQRGTAGTSYIIAHCAARLQLSHTCV